MIVAYTIAIPLGILTGLVVLGVSTLALRAAQRVRDRRRAVRVQTFPVGVSKWTYAGDLIRHHYVVYRCPACYSLPGPDKTFQIEEVDGWQDRLLARILAHHRGHHPPSQENGRSGPVQIRPGMTRVPDGDITWDAPPTVDVYAVPPAEWLIRPGDRVAVTANEAPNVPVCEGRFTVGYTETDGASWARIERDDGIVQNYNLRAFAVRRLPPDTAGRCAPVLAPDDRMIEKGCRVVVTDRDDPFRAIAVGVYSGGYQKDDDRTDWADVLCDDGIMRSYNIEFCSVRRADIPA